MNFETLKSRIGQAAALFPYIIMLAGLGLITLAFAVDFIGLGGSSGFGRQQARLAVGSLVVFLAGVVLLPPIKQVLLLRWMMPAVPLNLPDRTALRQISKILLIALWFGLVTGLLDLAGFTNARFFNPPTIPLVRLDAHVLWMAPVAGVSIMLATALLLVLAYLVKPKLVTLSTLVTVFAFFFALTLVFVVYPRLHIAAIPILAAGMAIVTARLIARYPERFYGLVRRTTLVIIAAVAAISLGWLGWDQWSDSRALAALPNAQANAPNVILITMDTVRARSMSLYGYDRNTTPNLERLARDGVTFDWAISPSPWTLPSHSSMFTGRWPHEVSSDFYVPLDEAYPTLAEVLSSHGYETAGFIANLAYLTQDRGIARGFVHYEDYRITPRQIIWSSTAVQRITKREELGRTFTRYGHPGRKNAATINKDFLDWVSSREDDRRPFFAFLNYFDAHDPYQAPDEFEIRFTGKPNPENAFDWFTDLPEEEIEELNGTYDAAIAYLDYQLWALFEELERRGIADDTLVIITSDHGEHFGEHRIMAHATSLYLPLIHVPLIISFPGRVPPNLRFDDVVSLRDVPATIIALLGIENKGVIPGESLDAYWNGNSVTPFSGDDLLLAEVTKQNWVADWYPVKKGDMKALILERKLYIKNGDGSEEIYDIDDDPLEESNLALAAQAQPMLDRFRTLMATVPLEAAYRTGILRRPSVGGPPQQAVRPLGATPDTP